MRWLTVVCTFGAICFANARIISIPGLRNLTRIVANSTFGMDEGDKLEAIASYHNEIELAPHPGSWCGSWSCKTPHYHHSPFVKPTKLGKLYTKAQFYKYYHSLLSSDFEDFNLDDNTILGRTWNVYQSRGLDGVLDETSASYWSYKDKIRWSAKYPKCGGTKQTPINLVKTESSRNKGGKCLGWANYNSFQRYLSLKNNGHTIEASSTNAVGGIPTLSGGPLTGTYLFASMHWHWGSGANEGSEHTLEGRQFPIELHLIHYNSKFATLSAAVASGEPEALCVVGIIYRNSILTNSGTSYLAKAMTQATQQGPQDKVVPLGNLALNFKDGYYTYQGSLTTPPCDEIVRWIVLEKTQPISFASLNVFRNIMVNGQPLIDNYREIQPLNGRKVEFYQNCKNAL